MKTNLELQIFARSLPLFFADGPCQTAMRPGGWISFAFPDTFAGS
jgi:hypothetical protein